MARPNKEKTKESNPTTYTTENLVLVVTPREIDGETVKFATLTIYDDITIYGCRVVKTSKGTQFLALPSRKGADGKYYHHAYIDKDSDLAQEINDLVATVD